VNLSFEKVLIVACANGGVIGVNNGLPWRLPEDLAHFKRLTTGHCIIMGRKTHESIGRPLPNRRNIVVTRHPASSALRTVAGIELAASLDEALALSQTPPLIDQNLAVSSTPKSPVFIIGGAQLYEQAMTIADRIELTAIDLDVAGDAFFPTISAQHWVTSSFPGFESPMLSGAGLSYRFQTCRRKHAAPDSVNLSTNQA
jgi:dihydrofolate reductase